MDLQNIIQPISPAQSRLYHTRHDLLHELIKDEKHIIFYHKDFKDGSCIICEQEPTHNVTPRNRPLHQWIESGNIIPSWKTFAQFITIISIILIIIIPSKEGEILTARETCNVIIAEEMATMQEIAELLSVKIAGR